VNADVVVPWQAGCPHRAAAFRWVLDQLERLGFPVHIATIDGPWCKAAAIASTLNRLDGDVVVVHDADVWSDATPQAAAEAAQHRSWAIPHQLVHRLTGDATRAVLDGADPVGQPTEQTPYIGVAAGGIVVLHRDALADVPLDCRFVGWGGEDHSWGYALHALTGPPWRGTAPLHHLWHPPAERITRRVGSYPSEQLRRRYFAARNDRPAMRALVEAGRHQAWPRPRSSSTGPASSSC